ncbi:ABC transporter substrate-binding protein [Tistrella bauzanensis]|uniref:ABC transporter substrate-binding protein n=1 Tax=Tistrella arctica TaxID=3133430 RepID=A0ABU9YFG4_9PROT
MFRILTAAVIGLGLASGAAAAAEMTKIRIATEGAYPPFNFVNEQGKLDGFDVDIANALCEKMKADCELVAQDWDGIIPGLLANKYDAIIAAMSITDERKQSVDFSDKYALSAGQFVAPKDQSYDDVSPAALAGKVIAVQRSTTHVTYLEDNYKDSDIRLYDTQDQANLDLVSGRADLTLADQPILGDWLKTDDGKGFHFVAGPIADPKWYGEGIGVAVRKGNDDLVAKFNEAIAAIRADGTFKTINDKWFNFDIYGE